MWQSYWEKRGRDFRLLGVAQEALGGDRVAAMVEEYAVTFPVLLDDTSTLCRALGFRIVPSGFFVDDAGTVRYRHFDNFDIADPRVRLNLERFLSGSEPEVVVEAQPMESAALDLFAQGVAEYAEGRRGQALATWQQALELDPDNFVIRSQIWVAGHPERFYPTVDRTWQELRLKEEGYDKPLP